MTATAQEATVPGEHGLLGRAVDVHCHYVSRDLLGVDSRFGARRDGAQGEALYFGDRRLGPLPPGLTDLDLTVANMELTGLTERLCCTASWLTCYWAEPSLGQAITRAMNESIARGVAAHPGRLMGLSSLPMQDVNLAVEELHYATTRLGLVGVAIGTNVNGSYLDDPRFEPLLTAAEQLGVTIFLHPHQVAGAERLRNYGLSRAIGNPHEAATALSRVILGGVLERHPQLRLCFPMGGGSIGVLLGRITHGWSVRPEARLKAPRAPAQYLRRCYFDTVVHSNASFELLLGILSPSQLLLGSDWPWDMGLDQPRRLIEDSSLDEESRFAVLAGNVDRLLSRSDSLADEL
jgi:aminocarboxymuconate-semialdehyde decarboxylase